MTALPAGSVEP